MTEREHQSAFARDIVIHLQWAFDHGYEVSFGEAERPEAMQKIYFESGKSKTMHSYHLRKLAFDIHFFLNGKLLESKAELQEIGDHWESLNPLNQWGGNWKSFVDAPHFERHV